MKRSTRLITTIVIGLAAGIACYFTLISRGWQAADFTFSWRAGQALLERENPYQVIIPSGEYPLQTYFYYPLTSALAAIPFYWFYPELAGAVFFGLSSALMAYALTQDGYYRLPIFLSSPFWVALAVCQWSPLIFAASILPWLKWSLACKPNIGLAGFLYNPSWRGLLQITLFLGLSLVILPGWFMDWIGITRGIEGHPPPIFLLPLGPLLLLSIFFWRKPEGRLLLALSVIPQLLFFYDQILIWLVPRSLRANLLFAGLSWVAYFGWKLFRTIPAIGEIFAQPAQFILALIYIPALVMLFVYEKPLGLGMHKKD